MTPVTVVAVTPFNGRYDLTVQDASGKTTDLFGRDFDDPPQVGDRGEIWRDPSYGVTKGGRYRLKLNQ